MEPDGSEVVDTGADTSDVSAVETQTVDNGNHPAWSELLGVLPENLHHVVKPHLEKWDKGVQDRFTKVQSEYAPYKDLVGIPAEQITASMNLARMIAENPRDFYDRMGQTYASEWGLNEDQGQVADDADDYSLDGFDEEGSPQIDLENNPLLKRLQEQQDIIANFLANDIQQKQAAQEAQAVAEAGNTIQTELTEIASTYGMQEIPKEAERLMLSLALQNEGTTLTDAAKEVMPLFAPKGPRPIIVGPGGGVPASNIDPAKMDRKDTKALITQMLAEAHRSN
jgi:hypothetical protein